MMKLYRHDEGRRNCTTTSMHESISSYLPRRLPAGHLTVNLLMNVFAGIAACFHTVKTFSNFELNYVRLIGRLNANACFAFIKRSHTVFLQRLSVLRTLYGNATGTFL